jgi:hypothetical protein
MGIRTPLGVQTPQLRDKGAPLLGEKSTQNVGGGDYWFLQIPT